MSIWKCGICFDIVPNSESLCPRCFPVGFSNPGPKPLEIVEKWYQHRMSKEDKKIKSDGGPSKYYDFPKGATTLNDLLEYKGDNQWLGDTFHLANVVKAAWRWGDKEGTTKEYDARKLIYSGCRLLMKYSGVSSVRETLQAMLDDPQFQERDKK